MFTLFEKYGFLRRLIIAYIGPGNNAMLNTYFTLLPTIGAHIRYMVYGVSSKYFEFMVAEIALLSNIYNSLHSYYVRLYIILAFQTVDSQISWEKGIKLSSRNNTEMKQFENVYDVLYRSHCISTCSSNLDTSVEDPSKILHIKVYTTIRHACKYIPN